MMKDGMNSANRWVLQPQSEIPVSSIYKTFLFQMMILIFMSSSVILTPYRDGGGGSEKVRGKNTEMHILLCYVS